MKILLKGTIKKIGKLFLHTLQNITHLLGPKSQFERLLEKGGGSACRSLGNTQLYYTRLNRNESDNVICFCS